MVLKAREEHNLFEISALSQETDVSCANTDVWRSNKDFKGVLNNNLLIITFYVGHY